MCRWGGGPYGDHGIPHPLAVDQVRVPHVGYQFGVGAARACPRHLGGSGAVAGLVPACFSVDEMRDAREIGAEGQWWQDGDG